jgi:threonine dehydrogenase-like Zn-dependent dehydrogenase/transcriptional regulator with GAF, ATPase, and Fis domain
MKIWKRSTAYLSNLPIPFFFKATKDDFQQKDMLQQICEFSNNALQANACSIFLVDPIDRTKAKQIAGTGYQQKFIDVAEFTIIDSDKVNEDPKSENEKLGITGWILSTGKPLLIRNSNDLYQHPHHLGKYDEDKSSRKIQAFIGVPIWDIHQKLIGVIKAEIECEAKSDGFSEQDESSLIKIAKGIALCLEYYNLSQEGKVWDAIKAWALDVIGIASSEESDLPSFIQSMVVLLNSIANAESCSIFLSDADGNYLTQYGGCGYQTNGNMIRSYRMPTEDRSDYEGLTTFIASDKKLFYIKSHAELIRHPAWRGKFDVQNFGEEQIRCEGLLGIPLIAGIDVLGVVKIENSSNWSRLEEPFSVEVRSTLSMLTQHIALAVLRLQSQASQRLRLIETATKTINDILCLGGELPKLVERALAEFNKALNSECCALFLMENNQLVQYEWGAVGYATNVQTGTLRKYTFVPREHIVDNPKEIEKVGLTVWIAATGRKFIAKSHDDLLKHPHWKHTYDKENFKVGDQCDSFIGVPLNVNNEILGVLKIENKNDPISGRRTEFTKEDELVFDLLASSIANSLFYYLKKSLEQNRKAFIQQVLNHKDKLRALGLEFGKKGLNGFYIEVPPIPDNAVIVKTISLGICGTDIQSFGGSTISKYSIVEFHEALGEVVWIGKNVDTEIISVGDIVVPIVRRCQIWDEPRADPSIIDFNFKPCKEELRCHNYRRPDICPFGEYPFEIAKDQYIGYRSRGTGKCHGFGSQYFIDTSEWLVRACTAEEIKTKKIIDEAKKRLILVEPLSVVWKMKREIEQVRPIRPFQDSVLILGLGPIGYLAAVLICTMYPKIKCVAVDRFLKERSWIKRLRQTFNVDYRELPDNDCNWDPTINEMYDRFDIIIEATGNPQNVIGKAIKVLAPNGALVLLSVLGRQNVSSVNISGSDLSAIVRKNGKIIGSVNESRDDFNNAVSFLRTFHSDVDSPLDGLINEIEIDPDKWNVIDKVVNIKEMDVKARHDGPKIVLKVAE